MNIIYILKEKQQEETHTQQNNECTTNMCILVEYCTKEKRDQSNKGVVLAPLTA